MLGGLQSNTYKKIAFLFLYTEKQEEKDAKTTKNREVSK